MIEVVKYTAEKKNIWDDFLDKSRIDTFLFKRDFMEYHADRFEDFSLMIYRKSKLVALLPANVSNGVLYSHQGLTYGGLITSSSLMLSEIIEIFDEINIFSSFNKGVKEIVYKPVPHIYHRYPAEEDIYALFRLRADRIACNISSTIMQNNKIPFIESRKSGIRKAVRNEIKVTYSNDLTEFWAILTENLSRRFEKQPVHTLEEIRGLMKCFPQNIIFYGAYYKECLVGGTMLFVMEKIVHVQYIAASEEGKKMGALDLIFDELVNRIYTKYPVFDFGQSTEQDGYLLNNGLIFQKEGFGGRGVIYETYKYEL